MARPQRMQRLNDAKSEVIAENVFKENPDGLEKSDDILSEKVAVYNTIPNFRKIIFLNGRDPGYPLDFHYSSATHPLKIYKLLHGKEYELPEEIISHLEQCAEPQYAKRIGVHGYEETFVVSKKYIFQCRNAPKKAA